MSYADLEIRILPARDDGYPVELTLDGKREDDERQEAGGGRLALAIDAWAPSGVAAADGAALFDLLFADPTLRAAWATFRGQAPQQRVRLRIDADAPALHAIPWELLRDAAGDAPLDLAATAATPFSRYLAGAGRAGGPIFKRPIRILVAIADPDFAGTPWASLDPIDADREWAILDEATAPMQRAGDVELVRLPGPCTLGAIEAELAKGFHVLHFVGHGAYSAKARAASLFLADAQNAVARQDSEGFAAMLARLDDADREREDRLRLVFLGSCETAAMDRADAFRGFAPALIRAGVPAVVAMQDKVPVVTATEFTRVFFTRLLEHGLVDRATNEARAAVLTAKLPGASMPVLLMRLRSGQLFGVRGEISGGGGDEFWRHLYTNIERGTCVPILGPRATAGLLPAAEALAVEAAAALQVTVGDPHNLARVMAYAQALDAATGPDVYQKLLARGLRQHLGLPADEAYRALVAGKGLGEITAAVEWSKRVRELVEDEPHHLLAELGLPLYLTTNADSFMYEALRAQPGTRPLQLSPRWQPGDDARPHYVLDDPMGPEAPVVLHLNGVAGDPRLVLSEVDYLEHYVRVSRDSDSLLPAEVIAHLKESSFLLLGFSVHDWAFRVVVDGLIQRLAASTRKVKVGVQLDVDDADAAWSSLRQYLGGYQIQAYRGSVRQFVSELHAGFKKPKPGGGTIGEIL